MPIPVPSLLSWAALEEPAERGSFSQAATNIWKETGRGKHSLTANTVTGVGMDLLYLSLSVGSPPTSSPMSCNIPQDPNSTAKRGTTSSHLAQTSSWPIWGD